MKFKKQIIDEIFKCYSVNALTIGGETHLIYAAEGPGSCQIYSGKDFSDKKILWENEEKHGGTMSVVPVRDREGCFYVSKGFHSMVESQKSAIYLIQIEDGVIREKKIVEIPFLHRFDVFEVEGERYLLAASLHGGKTDKEDWSQPGKLFTAKLPKDFEDDQAVELNLLKDGIYKNHGFNRGKWKERLCAYVAGEEGVIAVVPPQKGNDWQMEAIFDFPISDVAAIDLDGDGEQEFALLSPFHGNRFSVYKKIDGKYTCIYEHEKPLDFYHAIYADMFEGVPSFVIGARKEDMDLFIVQYDKEAKCCQTELIDTMVGSSNVRIIHTKEGDRIMSANRQIGEAALYSRE